MQSQGYDQACGLFGIGTEYLTYFRTRTSCGADFAEQIDHGGMSPNCIAKF